MITEDDSSIPSTSKSGPSKSKRKRKTLRAIVESGNSPSDSEDSNFDANSTNSNRNKNSKSKPKKTLEKPPSFRVQYKKKGKKREKETNIENMDISDVSEESSSGDESGEDFDFPDDTELDFTYFGVTKAEWKDLSTEEKNALRLKVQKKLWFQKGWTTDPISSLNIPEYGLSYVFHGILLT